MVVDNILVEIDPIFIVLIFTLAQLIVGKAESDAPRSVLV